MPHDLPDPGDAARARAFCLRAIAHLVRIDAPGMPPLLPATPDDPVLHALPGGLVAGYRVDEGGGRAVPVRQAQLRAAGLSVEALHANAAWRLAGLAEQSAEVQRFGQLFMVLAGAGLEASLVLCDEFWDDWHAGLAPGGFVAAVPAVDVLAFGDASSPASLRELDDLCTRIAPAADEPLSDRLLRRVGGRWEPLPD
jgi:hypothetical protein